MQARRLVSDRVTLISRKSMKLCASESLSTDSTAMSSENIEIVCGILSGRKNTIEASTTLTARCRGVSSFSAGLSGNDVDMSTTGKADMDITADVRNKLRISSGEDLTLALHIIKRCRELSIHADANLTASGRYLAKDKIDISSGIDSYISAYQGADVVHNVAQGSLQSDGDILSRNLKQSSEKGDITTTGHIASQVIARRAGRDLLVNSTDRAEQIANFATGSVKICASQIATKEITTEGTNVTVSGEQVAHRISMSCSDDGTMTVTDSGRICGVPVQLPDGSEVSFIDLLGGILVSEGVIAAQGNAGVIQLGVRGVRGGMANACSWLPHIMQSRVNQKLKLDASKVVIENASTSLGEDFSVALNIEGVGLIHVKATGKDFIVDAPTVISSSCKLILEADRVVVEDNLTVDGTDLEIHASKDVQIAYNVTSSSKLLISAVGPIEILAKQMRDEVSGRADHISERCVAITAEDLTLTSQSDIRMVGAKLKADKKLALKSLGNTICEAIIVSKRLTSGHEKSVYTDVEMKAAEVMIRSGEKYQGISNIDAEDNIIINATKGIDANGRLVQYISRDFTRTSGIIFKRVERDIEYATDVYCSTFHSKNGKIAMRAERGGISLDGAHIVGKVLGELIARDDINYNALLYKNSSHSSYSDWWGLSSGSASSSVSSAHASVLLAGQSGVQSVGGYEGSGGNISMISQLGDLKANGALLHANDGEAYFETSNGDIYMEGIILEHSLAVDERTFGFSLSSASGSQFLSHLASMQHFAKHESVVGAAVAGVKAVDDLRSITARANSIVGALKSGNLMGLAHEAGIGRFSIGYHEKHMSSAWTSMHSADIAAKSTTFVTKENSGSAHVSGSNLDTQTLNIDSSSVAMGSRKGHKRQSKAEISAGLNVDILNPSTGGVFTASLSGSKQAHNHDCEHQTHWRATKINFIRPALLTLHGDSSFEVDEIVGDSVSIERQGMGLHSSSHSLSMGASVGVNSASFSASEMFHQSMADSVTDGVAEASRLAQASQGKVQYRIKEIRGESTVKGWGMSIDAVGIAKSLASIGSESPRHGTSQNPVSIPLEAWVQSNDKISSFAVPSGSFQQTVTEIGQNVSQTLDASLDVMKQVSDSPSEWMLNFVQSKQEPLSFDQARTLLAGNKKLVTALVLQGIVYGEDKGALLKHVNVTSLIGESVVLVSSCDEAAIYYDRSSNVCYLSIRGTEEFARDVIGGDIGGMVGVCKDRIVNIKRTCEDKIATLKAASGCEVVITGHSLGGSEATALATLMDVNLVVTSNAPELVHHEVFENASQRRTYTPQVHLRLEGDVVSHLRSGSCRSFDDRKGITIPSFNKDRRSTGSDGVLFAHKISSMLNVVDTLLNSEEHIPNTSGAATSWSFMGI